MTEPFSDNDLHRLDQRIVEAYRATDASEAQLIINALEAQGIRAHMAGSNTAGGYAEVVGWHASPQVLVFENDVEAARKIIADATRDFEGRTADEE
ncbi:putative signal transducing protein [Rubinisphaera margarita]|uniref:putative signal transducing protein n=1 Tax=Rubinisphaera margarita TaxID=2909586 RepID=UPI001EE90312|nr:DUF2007 domain-containing protein [Rubinisphaera margarita]MCG6156083.1 DUF2007 domain-containing protein [Rubinisphaera margarita]